MENLSVFAPYDRSGGKIYKVHSLDLKSNPKSSFKNQKGEEITFEQYFKEKYKIQIKDLQ